MTQPPEHRPSTIMPSLEAKPRQLAGGLTPRNEAQLRAMHREANTDELSPSLQVKFQQCAAALTRDEATELRLLSRLVSGGTTDTVGHAIALYEGDPGNKGRPRPGVPANAAGGDPANVVTGTLNNLAMLIAPLAGFITRPL